MICCGFCTSKAAYASYQCWDFRFVCTASEEGLLVLELLSNLQQTWPATKIWHVRFLRTATKKFYVCGALAAASAPYYSFLCENTVTLTETKLDMLVQQKVFTLYTCIPVPSFAVCLTGG